MILRMAFRNILRQKRRSLFTVLSMFGGFVMGSIFIGWADGTYSHVIQEFTRNTFGHIQIHSQDYLDHPSLYKTLHDYPRFEKEILAESAVASCTPRIYAGAMISLGDNTTGGRIVGIDPERENRTTSFSRKIVRGSPLSSPARGEALIGQGMARLLHAAIGDSIVILSQGADGSIANERYRLVGLADTGDETADRMSLYLHIDDARELLVLQNRFHEVVVTVRSLNRVASATTNLRRAFPDRDITVSPWQEFARAFYIAMREDQKGMYVSLLIIVIVVAVGVLNTVLMSVLERQREYGLLKAIGTRPRQLVWLVLTESNLLGIASIIAGTIVAFAINYFLSLRGIALSNPLSYGGMKISRFYTVINANMFLIPALTVIVSATLVGVFPALKAARTEPARTMRVH